MSVLVPIPTQSLQAGDLYSVKGNVIVVTGGGTGLGRMMTEGFVVNGAKVYIVGRREEVLSKAAEEINQEFGKSGGCVIPVKGDISTKAGAKAIVDIIGSKETHVDTLVNNAAIQVPWKNPITTVEGHNDPEQVERLVWEGVEDEDWATTMAGNVAGPYFLTAAFVPLLKKSEIKSVVIIGSVAAIANQRPVSTLTYGVSKAAAIHLATMLAGRLSPLKIRVNTIFPGVFPSEITSEINEKGERYLKIPAGKAALRSPLARAGQRHEIVGPALLLASQAGGFMDNAVISVDGGRNMNAGMNDGIRMPEETY